MGWYANQLNVLVIDLVNLVMVENIFMNIMGYLDTNQ